MQNTLAEKKISQRIDWIDFTKGIAIILVIIGHTVKKYETGLITRGLIFSFHMPLFFILSCATFKCSDSIQTYFAKTKKAARHLLIPALVLFVIMTIYSIIMNPSLFFSSEFWIQKLYEWLFASGVNASFGDITVPAIGMVWFFLALFLSRSIFDYLHLVLNESLLLIITLISGLTGIILGQVKWLPFSLDVALAIMPFMFIGYKFLSFHPEKHAIIKMVISLLIWLFAVYLTFPDWQKKSYLELAIRRYPLFPVCFIAAVAGTIFFCEISILLCRLKTISRPVLYLGKNSLYIFCIHHIDRIWADLYKVEDHQFFTAGKRLLLDLIAFALFMFFRFLFKKVVQKIKGRSVA